MQPGPWLLGDQFTAADLYIGSALNFGMRWEYRPMFRDHLLNSTQFLPDYNTVQDGTFVHGAVVIPNQKAFGILNPAFAEAIAPTPIYTAAEVGIPESLRFSHCG